MQRRSIKKIILLSSILLPLFFYTHLYAGEANLTWERARINADVQKSCITDHAGFKLYYNTTQNDYSTFDDIGNIECIDSGAGANDGT